jgi:ABC-type molybdate transport system substrate-binding protein
MRVVATILMIALAAPASAEDVKLYAAGVLRAAMTEMAAAFKQATGNNVEPTFGSSGAFRERIIGGEAAHVFASASVAHAEAVRQAGKGGPVVIFARNPLCALARTSLPLTPATLLETIRKPNVKLGTFTPLADPAGDLAFAMFAKADGVIPGARNDLRAKVVHPTGGVSEDQPPAGRNIYAWFLERGSVDVFLTYCASLMAAQAELPDLKAVELPPDISVAADFGLTVMTGAPAAAGEFARFIQSPDGQAILKRNGFAPAAKTN